MKKRKMSALTKDFLVEIRKSMGRFLSIFFIVALGVSLFVGISATEPDMVLSGDRYADEHKLMDIKVVSTYGLTEEDLEAIGRLPSIEDAVGSYSADVLCESEDNMKVLHVMSELEDMNLVTVTEGRLPKEADECLVDDAFLAGSEYEIGDTLELVSGTDTELTDTLESTKLKIVGTGNTSLYFSFDRGSSTIGNGTVSGFLIVPPEAFALDVYTEIFAKVEGAEDVLAFTEEYDELIDEALEHIELIQNVRCEVRKDSLAHEAQLQIDDARNELNEKKKEAEEEIQENEDKLNAAELEMNLGKIQMEMGKAQIESGKAQIESGKAQIESGKAELEAGKAELEEYKKIYQQAMDALTEEKAGLEQQITEWEDILNGYGEEQQEEKEAALSAIQTLKDGIADLDEQFSGLTSEFEAEFEAGEKQIKEAESLLKEKEAELAAAEKELIAAEKELKKSESQLKSGEKEIKDGKEQLEDAKEEMESQIADGEEELAEAEKEIEDIELPIWYIFDRSSIPEYTGYGDNAARIAALSIVFPSIFFLVAALISLTTMTRMVEEQRVQIGTLKALGYSNWAIIKKYLYYALSATLGGSVLGVLLGEKLFPYIIIAAYKMTVYTNLPHIYLPYQWGYAIAATIVAVMCTVGAAVMACYKELMAQPAVLMRPEAPKIGKRTFIERIPFLWKHFNFSWKSSLRNLFRYKKRFFMTLFGIGGCMGLLMVGFGLRDSITSIADHQYGELQLYDNSIFISDSIEEDERLELERYLSNHNQIEIYMDASMTSITVEQDDEKVDAYLTVIEDLNHVEEFFTYRDRRSKKGYELSDEGIILTEKAASLIGAKAGDTILLSEDGRNEKKVEVMEVCENYAGHYVYMTSGLYEELYEEEPFYNNILVKAKDGVSDKELEKIGEEILKYEDILNVQYTKNLSSSLNDMLVALDSVMIVLIAVAGMLSFVVLYNLNNINITERRRELATLKVLGFFDMEVANYVYRENVLLTLLGVVVGCFIGRFLHYFTIVTVEVDMAMFGREVSLFSYGMCALFTIGFSICVNWIMYFKLKKIDMVESLKSVE